MPCSTVSRGAAARLGVCVVLALATSIGAARAQTLRAPELGAPGGAGVLDDAASPDEAARKHARALRQVSRSCKIEVARLCPSLPAVARPRDQAICLKFFKPSLSLPCRGAVTAATSR